jgi:hypothetical protein
MAEPDPPRPALFGKGKEKAKKTAAFLKPEVIGTITIVRPTVVGATSSGIVASTAVVDNENTDSVEPARIETSTPADVDLLAGTSFDSEINRILAATPILPTASGLSTPVFPVDPSTELRFLNAATTTTEQATACSAFSTVPTMVVPTSLTTSTPVYSTLTIAQHRDVIRQFDNWLRVCDAGIYRQWLETFPPAPCQFCAPPNLQPCRECVDRAVKFQTNRQE